jgi:hypothetical protein
MKESDDARAARLWKHRFARLCETRGMTFYDLPNVSDGHRRCMRAVLAEAQKIEQPVPARLIIVAHENDDGSVTTIVTDEADARARSVRRPDMIQAIDVVVRRARTLETPIMVLAIDDEGMCVATCIECGKSGDYN